MTVLAMWLGLVGGFALGTLFLGVWSLPLIAALWGAIAPTDLPRVRISAAAASAAWGVLLLITSLHGPLGRMADILGSLVGLPSVVLIALTLALPALLAAGATGLLATLRA